MSDTENEAPPPADEAVSATQSPAAVDAPVCVNDASNTTSNQTPEPAVVALPPEPPASVLVGLFKDRRGEFEWWLDAVLSAFTRVAPLSVRAAIHSTRGRVKDPDHLERKIARKRGESPPKRIDTDNFFDEIEDLAAVRVLTLYRADTPIVHRFILEAPCWTVAEAPVGYYTRPEDRLDYEKWCIKPVNRPENPYTSVHYIVTPRDSHASGPKRICCEIQLRSLHLEAWGEVDHQLRYPDKDPGPLATEILRVLHEAAAITDGLARIARRASEVEEQLRAEAEEAEKRAGADQASQEEKIRQLESQLEDVRQKFNQAKNRPDELAVAQIASHMAQLSGSLGRASAPSRSHYDRAIAATSSSFGGDVVGVRTEGECGVCGLNYGGLGVGRMSPCARCGRAFCHRCAADPNSRFGGIRINRKVVDFRSPPTPCRLDQLCKECYPQPR